MNYYKIETDTGLNFQCGSSDPAEHVIITLLVELFKSSKLLEMPKRMVIEKMTDPHPTLKVVGLLKCFDDA